MGKHRAPEGGQSTSEQNTSIPSSWRTPRQAHHATQATDEQARAAGLAVGGSMPGDRSGLNAALAGSDLPPRDAGITAETPRGEQ